MDTLFPAPTLRRSMPRSAPGVTRKPMIESQGDTRQTQCAWCLRDHLETNRSLMFAARLRHAGAAVARSAEQTSERPSLMRNSYAVLCSTKTKNMHKTIHRQTSIHNLINTKKT